MHRHRIQSNLIRVRAGMCRLICSIIFAYEIRYCFLSTRLVIIRIHLGCVEEVLNPSAPPRTVYTTTAEWIFYEGVLQGGELNILPTEANLEWDKHSYLNVKPEEGDTSYAFRALTQIKFSVQGVQKVEVFLVARVNGSITVRQFKAKCHHYDNTSMQ